jgi:hypothetical protein
MTTETADLGSHEGRPVIGTKIKVRKTGDGLSEALKIDPEIIKVGEERMLAVRVVCVDVQNPAENRKQPAEGGVLRMHIFDATEAAFIDGAVVEDVLAKQRERIDRAKDAEVGQGRLPTDEELHAAHDAGEHSAGLVDGCADCDHEADLEAAENTGPAEQQSTKLHAVHDTAPAKRTSQRAPKK